MQDWCGAKRFESGFVRFRSLCSLYLMKMLNMTFRCLGPEAGGLYLESLSHWQGTPF